MTDPADIGVLDQFQTDFKEAWGRLPNKGFFFVLLAVWLALFHFVGNSTFGYFNTPSLLGWMANTFAKVDEQTDERQGLFIPFVVLALFWWKRKELLALQLRTWWPGLFLVAAGLLFHLVGYAVQQPRISILGLFLGLYGLMGLAWGPALLRKSIFPFFLFIFCMPLSTLIEALSVPLQILVCRIVELVAQNVLGIDVLRAGTQLYDSTGRYRYEIVAACSGIRSLVSIGVMATLFGFLFFPKWWQRLLLMGSSIPLAIAGNVLRLTTIIMSGEIWGQQGGDYIHEGGPFGIISMLPYVPAFFGLFACAKWLQKRKDSASEPI